MAAVLIPFGADVRLRQQVLDADGDPLNTTSITVTLKIRGRGGHVTVVGENIDAAAGQVRFTITGAHYDRLPPGEHRFAVWLQGTGILEPGEAGTAPRFTGILEVVDVPQVRDA